jgi:hypothetical protein
MKRIVISQENTSPIILYDKEYSNFSTYALDVSELMKSKEITLFETTSGTIIIKPSKITSIHISEVEEKTFEPTDMIVDT